MRRANHRSLSRFEHWWQCGVLSSLNFVKTKINCFIGALLAVASTAYAAEFSDAAIGYSHGERFREPGNELNIAKDILTLWYFSTNSLGSNFFNVDMLQSDRNDPANNGTHGAQEVYVVYRNYLSLGKLSKKDYSFGPVRDVGLRSGFDYSSKNSAFGGAEQKLMVGPEVEFDVPGYLSLSVMALKDWGNNSIVGVQVNSDVTYRVALNWIFDLSLGLPATFRGWATYTGTRGTDGFGNGMHPETWTEMALLWDVGTAMGATPKKYLAGVGYQYIKNKFNVQPSVAGSRTSTPMLRAEVHF